MLRRYQSPVEKAIELHRVLKCDSSDFMSEPRPRFVKATKKSVLQVGPASAPLDRWGAFMSALCAVHCLVFAFLPGLITALGLGVVFVPAVEWMLVLTALAIATSALFFGWRRHRSPRVLFFFICGAAGLIASRACEEIGIEGVGLPLSVAGAACLIVGHFFNWRQTRARAADTGS